MRTRFSERAQISFDTMERYMDQARQSRAEHLAQASASRPRLFLAGGIAAACLMVLGFGEPVAGAKCMLGGDCEVAPVSVDAGEARITLASLGGGQSFGALRADEPPKLIVLPFKLLNGRPRDIDLATEMTDEVIAALSHAPQLQVISRNTSFTYSNAVKHQADEVATELGVRYAVQVWIQHGAGKVRADLKLFDAEQGSTILSEKIDVAPEDAGELGRLVLQQVANSLALDPSVAALPREQSQDRSMAWLPSSVQTWTALRQKPNAPDAIATARRWIEDALHADPDDARPGRD